MVGAFSILKEDKHLEQLTLLGEVEPAKKKSKVKPKQIAEILIPQEFDYIEWAEKLTKLAKDKSVELVFKDRPQEYWGTDPTIPQTKIHFEEMLHHISKYDDITCDVETGGLSFVNKNILICGHVFTAGDKSFYLPLRHNTKEWQLPVDYATKVLREEVYGRKDATLNFHNVAFDYNQLLKDGIDLSWRFKEKSIIDTQVMWWLLDENQKDDDYYYILQKGKPAVKTKVHGKSFPNQKKAIKAQGGVVLDGFSLKTLGPKYVGIPMTKFDDLMELIGFPNLPIHFGGAYAKVDGDATHAIKQMGMPRIYQEKLDKAMFHVEMPFARVNGNMQRRGMGVNLKALDRLHERTENEINRLTEELFAVTGPMKFSGKQLTALFHDQMGLPVLAKTDKGNPQFNEEAMDKYEQFLEENGEQYGDKAKLPSMIIRIKKLEKILGTYITGNKGLRPNIDVDGRVHCSLFQTGTVTGRLSSGNPNLQNLPTKPVFVDELNRDEMIRMRNEKGDLFINKVFDFSVLFLDEDGEAIKHKDGWEEKCVKVVESWGFRDVFSEKGFTPELREKYLAEYPRYGEVDAYVKPIGHCHGELVTINVCNFANTEEEHLLLVSDYSQMELRMIAHLANATSMIEAYKSGVDVHLKTASDVFDVPLEKVTKDQRSGAKGVNFGVIYGKTDYGFAEDWYSHEPDFKAPSSWHPSGFEPAKKYLEKARAFIDKYFEGMPEVKAYIDSRQELTMKNGYTRSITGRKRRLPEIFSSNNSVRNRAKRQTVNAIDQGSSADYLKISMNKLENKTDELADKGIIFFQLLTVHDEIIFQTQKNLLQQVEEIVVEGMTKSVPGMRCPIETEPVAVYTYGSAK
jgi:DNA polymerase I-like protein with 3'-5' exonuclease and polymerase domains